MTFRYALRGTPATSLITDERAGAEHEGAKSKASHHTELTLLMAVLLLGSNAVVVKYTVSAIPPLPLVALRFVVAGLLLLGAVGGLGKGGGGQGKGQIGKGHV